METDTIIYRFILPDESRETFRITLDSQRIVTCCGEKTEPPAWAALDFYQCPHCPLESHTHPACPLAVNLVEIVARLDKLVSHSEIVVRVSAGNRIISTRTTIQRAISSMMGLLIATSECPHTHLFKPMARFHLPFASDRETIWRAVSTYLVAQYFRSRQGQPFDTQLKGFSQVYENIQVVNKYVAKRLRAATEKDSTVNALIILDVYAQALPPAIEEAFTVIQPLFEPYLNAAAT